MYLLRTRLRQALWDYPRVSLRALAVWRICVGAVATLAIVRHWWTSDLFIAAGGVFPVSLSPLPRWTTPLSFIDHPAALHVVFASFTLVGLCFTAGFGTKFVRWLLLPALASIHNRVPILLTGGSAVLQLQVAYSLLLPIGERWSVDATLRERRTGSAAPADWVRSWGYPLVLVSLAVNYAFNAINKIGPQWEHGTAIAQGFGNVVHAQPLGAWLADAPPLFFLIANYATLAVEGVLPLLLVTPWKRRQAHLVAAVLMVGLHTSIELTLSVGIFSFAMLAHVPLLLPWGRDLLGAELEWTRVRRRVDAFASAFLLYVLVGRLGADNMRRFELVPFPRFIDVATRVAGLRQGWGMYMWPSNRSFTLVVEATTESGRKFDPWQRRSRGSEEVLRRVPAYAGQAQVFSSFEARFSRDRKSPGLVPFAEWVMKQTPEEAPDDRVQYLDLWTLSVQTDSTRRVPHEKLAEYHGVYDFPIPGSLPVAELRSTRVWSPERVIDGQVLPEEAPGLSPFAAVLGAGCSSITLDLGAPKSVRAFYFQSHGYDPYLLDVSDDGVEFRHAASILREGRTFRSRLVKLPGDEVRFLRLRPMDPGAARHHVSEVAVFDRDIELPTLPHAPPDQEWMASRQQPAVVSLFAYPKAPETGCPGPKPPPEEARRP